MTGAKGQTWLYETQKATDASDATLRNAGGPVVREATVLRITVAVSDKEVNASFARKVRNDVVAPSGPWAYPFKGETPVTS